MYSVDMPDENIVSCHMRVNGSFKDNTSLYRSVLSIFPLAFNNTFFSVKLMFKFVCLS
jgi:hypothetical protein